MASASDIRAGKAFIELGMKDSFSKDFKAVENRLRNFGASLTALGGKMIGIGSAIAAPLLLATQRFISIGSEIERASQRTGIAVETLIELKYAAEQTGASLDDVVSAVGKMQRNLLQLAEGGKKAVATFHILHLGLDQLKNLSPDQQLLTIADALKKLNNPGIEAALALQIFGKGAGKLIPLLNLGSNAIQRFMDRAKELGLVFSNEDAVAAVKFANILNDLWNQINAVAFQFGAAIANALMPFARAASLIMSTVIQWVKVHRDLVISLIPVAAGLIATGAAIVGVGLAFTIAATAMSGFRAAINGVTSAISTIGSIAKLAFGVAASAIGLLANPLILGVVAALVIAGIYMEATSKKGIHAFSYLANTFIALKTVATEAFSGIADSLSAGDISLAAQILWTSLQLLWTTGTEGLRTTWTLFKTGIIRTAIDAFAGIQTAWEVVETTLAKGWLNLGNFIATIWDSIVGGFTDSFNRGIADIVKGINYVHHLADSSFDSKKANTDIDNDVANRETARRNAEGDRMKARDADLASQIALLDSESKTKLDEIANAKSKGDTDATNKAISDIAALTAKKADLQRQLDELTKQAKKEKDNIPAYQPLYNPDKGIDLGDIRDLIKPFKSQGTFNGSQSGLLSLGAGSQMDRLVKATEETAKNTKKATTVNYEYSTNYT